MNARRNSFEKEEAFVDVVVVFEILRDGTVTDVSLEGQSGIPVLDR